MKHALLAALHPREHELSYDLCLQAANNIYSDHERVAQSFQAEYVQDMEKYCEMFSRWATEENLPDMISDLEELKMGYLKKRITHLASLSRCASAFITGPSNFPARQMEKRNATERKRSEEWVAWVNKKIDRLERKYNPTRSTAISSDDADAIEKLSDKIEQLEENQETMKSVNKILRKKGTLDQKKQLLLDEGLSEEFIETVFTPDVFGGIGFQQFTLTNNAANIRRLKGRLETLRRQRQDTTHIEQIGTIEVRDNVEENRVQIVFPERVPKEFYTQIRREGFVYSKTNQAFQRKRSSYALQKARALAESYQS